jgi:hypothetical protein
MQNFTVFYRVPAKLGYYGTYLSCTRVEAESREAALAKFTERNPTCTEIH